MRANHFEKMQGCGNDFLLLDGIREAETLHIRKDAIRFLCDRNFGIGADGLILLNRSVTAQAKWNFYNCDGSEANMCGNAARCAVRYLADKYFPTEELITIETKDSSIKGKRLDDAGLIEVSLNISLEHRLELRDRSIRINEAAIRIFEIDTGVPHAVIEVKNIMEYPIEEVGRALVKHAAFGNAGSNITFFQPLVGSQILSTTFERGVEKETLACGTGAAAAAIVFSDLYSMPFPIQVEVPGGILQIDSSPVAKKVLLRGQAEYLFSVVLEELPRDFSSRRPYSQGGLAKDTKPI